MRKAGNENARAARGFTFDCPRMAAGRSSQARDALTRDQGTKLYFANPARYRGDRLISMASNFEQPLTPKTVHLCIDMQRIFSPEGPWATPWMARVLPVVTEIASRFPERTVFT